MTKTEKTYKKPSEMTAEEKAERIFRLQNKFYDIETVASVLLETEIERAGMTGNKALASGVDELKKLEANMIVLTQEYNIRVNNELIPLTRGFEQERKNLMRQHEQERARILRSFVPKYRLSLNTVVQKQQRELNTLRQRQRQQRADTKERISADLDKCHNKMYIVFMRNINQIYK